MKKYLILILSVVLIGNKLNAQYETAVYDKEKKFFNQGQVLPTEKNFIINGEIAKDIDFVSVELFRSGKHKNPLYYNTWKRAENNKSNKYELPINYWLRDGSKYDLVLREYNTPSEKDKNGTRQTIENALENYLESVFVAKNGKLQMNKSVSTVMKDMNKLTNYHLRYYNNTYEGAFTGYSDMVRHKLKQICKGEQDMSFYIKNQNKPKDEDKKDRQVEKEQTIKNADKQIGALGQQLNSELAAYLNSNDIFLLKSTDHIVNYPVEKTRNILSVNVGYGGVYLNSEGTDISTLSGVYAGISLPFASSALAPAFFQNMSISTGVFIKNLKEESSGTEWSGPFVNRPVYVALGYKVLQFIRINAGTAILEDRSLHSNSTSDINFKPFVGVSAEINLWAALGHR
ncbi:MAG: hypothetical protein R2798_00160 [Chitinophagales bacterium]|nr:hypothetical protein [Bacteroidota bacterium]MCB9043812.1 hypothetical protein [Chitinophagales bacterium]